MTTDHQRATSGRSRRCRRATPVRIVRFLDERLSLARPARSVLNRVFPDHWSFMLGEVALYSFIVLALTGTYLAFFFDPSTARTVYHGRYVPLDGVPMSRAYASTLSISFDVRGGLLIRQIHYWAALLFIAALFLYLVRVFFTGAFRKPRELNWLIGLAVLVFAVVESYTGHLLPDDLLSGTGLRVVDASVLSIPVVGTWLAFLIFGGPFPGHLIIGRLYIAHVLLIPGILVVLIATHLVIAARHKPAQFPGPGRSERTISGQRLLPTRLTKSGALFFLVFGVLAVLGGWAQINPVWLYGPYNPAQVSAGSGPDWYLAFVDGASRLFPSWDIRVWGHDVPPVFWATVALPGVLVVLAAAYPFIEARLTNDRARHHLLQRPRDVPVRTSLGAMALSFVVVLFVSAGNDTIARAFEVSLNAMIWAGRIALLTVPPIVYLVSYRLCLGLQRHDRQVLEHGVETGMIKMLPSGAFIEVHQPLGPVDEPGHGRLSYAGAPVPKRINQLRATPTRVRGFFYPVTEKPHLQAAIDDYESTLPAERAHAPLGSAQTDDRAGPDRDVRI